MLEGVGKVSKNEKEMRQEGMPCCATCEVRKRRKKVLCTKSQAQANVGRLLRAHNIG